MKKIIILLLIFINILFASSKICYSVQLVSKFNTKENIEELKNSHYPDGCKGMKIGNYLTVRCGCLDDENRVRNVLLPKLKKEYKDAIFAKTARYRFAKEDDFKTQKTKQDIKSKIKKRVK